MEPDPPAARRALALALGRLGPGRNPMALVFGGRRPRRLPGLAAPSPAGAALLQRVAALGAGAKIVSGQLLGPQHIVPFDFDMVSGRSVGISCIILESTGEVHRTPLVLGEPTQHMNVPGRLLNPFHAQDGATVTSCPHDKALGLLSTGLSRG